jgi:predicted RNA-binding Zn-ribbon protein involved in translation (DUF1610 family)
MNRHTHIIVSCRDCGQTRIPVSGVTIRGCLDDDQWSYRFTCPECGLPTVEATSATRALDAAEIGVNLETWRYPAEMHELHDGPKLNLVDVLELHRALVEPDWFDALIRAGVEETR